MPVPVEFQRDERVERRRARRRQIRRRRIAATVVLAAVVGMVAASSTGLFGGKKQTGQAAPTATEIQPGLGTTILPTYRVVAVVGAPGQDASLGRGSIGTPNEGVRVASEELAPQYAGDKPVLPAFMLIATLATEASNGGRNSTRLTDAQIETYLTAARNHGAILILDIQPGHSPWMDEVRAYTRWLKEPDVSLAIDPEWNMPPGKNPGEVFGTTSAAEINVPAIGPAAPNTSVTGFQVVEVKNMVIRGEEVEVTIFEGTDANGYVMRQLVTSFPGKNGTAMLMVMGSPSTWDDKLIDGFIESIR